MAIIYRLLNEEPEDLRAIRPDLPDALCGVILRSLAKSPQTRFASACEMAQALALASDAPAPAADETVVVRARVPQERVAGMATLDPAVIESLERRLAVFVGPLARVLVRNAVPKASSLPVLWRQLSAHIESPEDRAAFMAKASPGP